MFRSVACVALLVSSMAIAAGCGIRTGSRTGDVYHTPTLGEELVDLQAARDQGAIEDGEYERAKAALMERPRRRALGSAVD